MNEKLRCLRNKIRTMDLDGMIVSNPVNIKYLTNIEAEGTLVLARKENFFITDGRYIEDVNSTLTINDEIIVCDIKDLSKEDFENNIAVSKKVVEMAHAKGIPVEAELGKVGGKEDDLVAEADTNTDVNEAVEFVERTGVDSLAIAIGTAHGFYVGTPVLDKERLSEIAKVVSIPLVLHGASGISDEDVADCVSRGISKVNFATELRVAFTDACKKLYVEKPETFDPKAYGKVGMAAVKKLVMNRMRVCGCDGKAE